MDDGEEVAYVPRAQRRAVGAVQRVTHALALPRPAVSPAAVDATAPVSAGSLLQRYAMAQQTAAEAEPRGGKRPLSALEQEAADRFADAAAGRRHPTVEEVGDDGEDAPVSLGLPRFRQRRLEEDALRANSLAEVALGAARVCPPTLPPAPVRVFRRGGRR